MLRSCIFKQPLFSLLAATFMVQNIAAKEVVFIDAALQDRAVLEQGLHVKPYLLDAQSDPLEQIAEVLRHETQLDAVHIISHGERGALHVSHQTIDNERLHVKAQTLKSIGASLKEGGDILLYGCDVASGDKGEAFVKTLAALTQADVAASTNPTGSATLGGDWVLEANTGVIDKNSLDIHSFNQVLATPTDQDFESEAATDGSGISSSLTAGDMVYSLNGSGLVDLSSDPGGYAAVDSFTGLSGKGILANYGLTYNGGAITTFTMSSSNLADDFKLNSLIIGVANSNFGTYTIQGFQGGSGGTKVVEVEGVDITSADTTFGTGNDAIVFDQRVLTGNSWGGLLTFGSAWDNIDTVVFIRTNAFDLNFVLDSIDFSDPTPADSTPPAVTSIAPTGSPAQNASVVIFGVTFDESASNISTDDFELTATGSASGTVALVSASSGASVDVTVNGISGVGTLRLDLKANTNIIDATGNGNNTNGYVAAYTSGTTHTVDRVAPTVTSITSATPNGTKKIGDVIDVTLNFSETVFTGGTTGHTLTLETGATDRTATYSSGSGSSSFSFSYTVQSGDLSADLDYAGVNALTLNTGTIKDAAGNDATLTLPIPGAANSLGANKNLVIDGVRPLFDTAPAADAITAVGFTPTASLNESGTIYYVVVSDGDSAPSVADVKAGTANGGAAAASGNSTLLSSAPYTASFSAITTLSGSTDYDL